MMDGIWQWGLVVITTLQSARGPTLLWCVDARLGFRLGVLVLISFYCNSLIKSVVGHPRPFNLDPSVKLMDAKGYGLPSGHAQSAALVWGGVAAYARYAVLGLWISLGAPWVFEQLRLATRPALVGAG